MKTQTTKPKPRRTRSVHVRISERELAAIIERAQFENLSCVSDYLRKAALDRAEYRASTPTLLKP